MTEQELNKEQSQSPETDDFADYAGEIVRAVCETEAGNRIIGRFDGSRRVAVAKCEFSAPQKIGDAFDVYIEGLMKNGMWGGSIDKIAPFSLWKKFEKMMREETDCEAQVISAESNGLTCDVSGVAAFLPTREIAPSERAPHELVGKTLPIRIIKMSQQRGQIIVSQKAAVEQALREARENILTNLKAGQEYEAVVRQIVDFGVFADIGAGVEGLIHRSNLSWENDDPAKCVCVGERIRVVVLSADKGRIALGRKQLVKDCWASAAQTLHPGDIAEGKVTTFTTFGAFVRLSNGLEGLVHNSELSWDDSIRQAKQAVKLGETVRVSVMEIDTEKRRLRLSLRRVSGDPWEAAVRKYPVGAKVSLPVASVADFGIFLDMGDHIRGLVHKNDIAWNDEKIDLASRYRVGAPVECVVLGIDAQRRRASLGIKQLSGDPWAEFMALEPLGKQYEATVRRLAKFGAFAELKDFAVEGLIHVSELSERRVDRIESVVKPGDAVTATVVQIDPGKRRLGLSLIAEPFAPAADDQSDGGKSAEPAVAPPTMADIFPDILKPPVNV